jgi:hypothetical protein
MVGNPDEASAGTIGLDREKILIGVFSEWDLKAY